VDARRSAAIYADESVRLLIAQAIPPTAADTTEAALF